MEKRQSTHTTNYNYKINQTVDERRERNGSALISRLAVELLSAIFLELRNSTLLETKYSYNSENSRRYLGAKDWIRVTHFFSYQLSAPLLESLRIACRPSAISSVNPPFIFDDQLFHAPVLKKLSIVGCRIDWDSQSFRNLTHLRVCYPPNGHRVTISRFLGVL
ncbi:hypothetical protein CPB83DRAFT_221097 [Crepidotus variabilis]|uniref:Uncharacterized protein n=1 Tax=Crepidotus variabilis TaxID=179855 RepID=A0A9P6JWD9_9AGAR|nr:hypothetical protein CPB83DRAFT_221097 [Crepidotus variabilis]